MNYPKLRKNLSVFLIDRHIQKKYGTLEDLYKTNKTFNTDSNEFTVKFSTIGLVGKSHFYQLMMVLEDEHGKLFKHASRKMNYVKLSNYVSNRFDQYLLEQPFEALLESKPLDLIKSKLNSKSAVDINIKDEVEGLYKTNHSLKSIIDETFYISANLFSLELVEFDNSFNLFNEPSDAVVKTSATEDEEDDFFKKIRAEES